MTPYLTHCIFFSISHRDVIVPDQHIYGTLRLARIRTTAHDWINGRRPYYPAMGLVFDEPRQCFLAISRAYIVNSVEILIANAARH